jgi:predicted  nucleic acid-binding Zn-ribbon protein
MLEFKLNAEIGQQILAAILDLNAKIEAMTVRMDLLEQKIDILTVRVDSLEKKVDTLTLRVDALEATVSGLAVRVDSLEINLSDFKKEVREEFRIFGDKVVIVEKKVVMIESRQIDLEQKLISLEIQIESRFYSLEVLLDKNADPMSVKNKSLGKMGKGRING